MWIVVTALRLKLWLLFPEGLIRKSFTMQPLSYLLMATLWFRVSSVYSRKTGYLLRFGQLSKPTPMCLYTWRWRGTSMLRVWLQVADVFLLCECGVWTEFNKLCSAHKLIFIIAKIYSLDDIEWLLQQTLKVYWHVVWRLTKETIYPLLRSMG